MSRKNTLMLGLAVLALAALACQTVMGGPEETFQTLPPEVTAVQIVTSTQQPTATPEPTTTPEPSPTVMTPEMRLSGSHPYTVTKTENTCSLTLSAEEQIRLLEFEGDQLRVWHLDLEEYETYDQIAPQRYLRYNSNNLPIMVEISMEGYVLNVYDEGADVNQDSPCGYFTFSLAD